MLKFFTNSNSTAYLRSLATEFGESTNSVRLELNNLSEAGYLTSAENGRTIEYRANKRHPLFPEIKSVVHKYLGLDKIVEMLVDKLGRVDKAFVTGDYAKGIDSGIIDLVLVGDINTTKLDIYCKKCEELIKRKLRTLVLSDLEYQKLNTTLAPDQAIWLWGDEK